MPAVKRKKRKRTLKQKKWLANFLKTGNKAEATRRAGYNMGSKGGSKTKAKRQVNEGNIGYQNYIKLQKTIEDLWSKNKNIDAKWVLKRLIKEAELDLRAQDRLKALELIGKHKKMFTDKVEHSGGIEKKVKIYLPEKKDGKG